MFGNQQMLIDDREDIVEYEKQEKNNIRKHLIIDFEYFDIKIPFW